MKRPVLWMSLLGLLCGSLAFGQGKVDPVFVGNVRTDYFESIVMDADTLRYSDTVPTNRMWLSVQHAFDSVDVVLRRGPFLLTSDWLFLDPDTNTTQSVFDWIDTYMGVDTNEWGYLAPTASTVQATFTWLDGLFSGFGPDDVVMPGSNIVGGTLVSNQWTGLMPGTNIVGGDLVDNQWTGLMPGTNITGFTLNDETLSWDPVEIETELAGYSMVPLFDVWSTNQQAGAGFVQILASAYEVVVTNAPDSGFNPSTGVFTAPQTGYYYFVAVGRFSVAVDNHVGLGLAAVSWATAVPSPYVSSRYPHTGGSGTKSVSGLVSQADSLFKYMEANDTMCIWFHGSVGFTNWHKAFQGFALR